MRPLATHLLLFLTCHDSFAPPLSCTESLGRRQRLQPRHLGRACASRPAAAALTRQQTETNNADTGFDMLASSLFISWANTPRGPAAGRASALAYSCLTLGRAMTQ